MTDRKFNPNHDRDDGRFASGGGGGDGGKKPRFTSESVAQMEAAIAAGDAGKLRELRARVAGDDSLRQRTRNAYRDKIDQALAKIGGGAGKSAPPGAHKVYNGF